MNDPKEGNFIEGLYFTNSVKKQEEKAHWEKWLEDHQPFIFSTSRTDKLNKGRGELPMWSLYGEKGTGGMFRFSYRKLNLFCSRENLLFRSCQYDIKSNYITKMQQRKDLSPQDLLETAAFSKLKDWEYEKEWRILFSATPNQIKEGSGKGGVIKKYVELAIPIDCIEEICIGPLVNEEKKTEIEWLIQQLLASIDLSKKIKVTKSKIVIRE
jgi:hypothetical protein